MRKKAWNYLIKLVATAMAVVYALQYFNAFGRDEDKDIFNADDIHQNGLMQLFMAMSVLFTASQLPEIYDHMPYRTRRTRETEFKTLSDTELESVSLEDKKAEVLLSIVESCKRLPRYESVMRSLGGLTAGTLVSFALVALWQDSRDLARHHLPGSVVVFMLSGGRFLLLQGRHVFALVMGRQQQLMQAMTEGSDFGEEEEMQRHAMVTSPALQASLFIVYTLTHIADSALLVNEEGADAGVYWMSVIGLSASVACYNLTHTLNIRSAYYTLKNLPSMPAKVVGVAVALLAGSLEASQTTLGLMGLLSQPRKWLLVLQGLAIGIEFATGFIEASQHASQRIALWINRHVYPQQNRVLPSSLEEDDDIPPPSVSRDPFSEQDEIKQEVDSEVDADSVQEEEGEVINRAARPSTVEMQPLSAYFFSSVQPSDDIEVSDEEKREGDQQAALAVQALRPLTSTLPRLPLSSPFSVWRRTTQGFPKPLLATDSPLIQTDRKPVQRQEAQPFYSSILTSEDNTP